jgi:hypothetical protein
MRTVLDGDHVVYPGSQFRIGGAGSPRLQPAQFAWTLGGGELKDGYSIVRLCDRVGCVAHIDQLPFGELPLVARLRWRTTQTTLTPDRVLFVRSLPNLVRGVNRGRGPGNGKGSRPSILPILAREWGVPLSRLYQLRTRSSRARCWKEVA